MNDIIGRRWSLVGSRSRVAVSAEPDVLDVHLKSNAIDGDSALPEIADHCVDRVRLGVYYLCPGLVVKQQSLRIGFMCPAETALNVGAAVCSQADSGLVEPERAPQFSR